MADNIRETDIYTQPPRFSDEVVYGPWRRGWADVCRKMEAGEVIEVPNERQMRSLIQTLRTTGFRSMARKKADGGYVITKLGPRPKMIWTQVWKNGIQVRRQIPEPGGETMPAGVTVTLRREIYEKLQNYCGMADLRKEEVILRMVERALVRHERYAAE